MSILFPQVEGVSNYVKQISIFEFLGKNCTDRQSAQCRSRQMDENCRSSITVTKRGNM